QSDPYASLAQPLDQQPSGQITNDVGNTVIVPKENEPFADTMQRAAAQGRKTTPEQTNREVATMPEKVAETLVAAPVIGAGLTALEAGPNEVAGAVKAGLAALIPAATRGVQGFTAWAAEHPYTAKVLWEGLKYAIAGTTAGAASKIAGKVIKS